ncbi:hypothetical protein [Campylobacter molothri]|uniref:hypothetical protein n=1 Tax=Campylobacter molothri TaxID=1032242 RepID=UPI001EFC27CA|nr:hypothetical protein [Campylobacter sp. RM10537]MBZ7948811.1 hypothetical protein [Campylobacter sp. RM10534]
MQTLNSTQIAPYINNLSRYFNNNLEVKRYHISISKLIISHNLANFIFNEKNKKLKQLMKLAFVDYLKDWSLDILNNHKDPLNYFSKCPIFTNNFLLKNKLFFLANADSKEIFHWLSNIFINKNLEIQNQANQIQILYKKIINFFHFPIRHSQTKNSKPTFL